MKKSIGMILALFAAVSVFNANGAAIREHYAQQEEAAQKAARITNLGFTLAETGTIDMIGADTFLYTHNKTGGRVLHIANDDKNRSFFLAFDTPSENEKGITHILEHMSLMGNEKYPSAALFFALIYQTYNTGMNAYSSFGHTAYYYTSLSEEQLLMMADYYMNAAFFPMFYAEERLFQREAWRYTLESADAPLDVTGIIYNEMQGANNINFASVFNFYKTLYPGSTLGNNIGGVPEAILTLTSDEVKEFHQIYYHPSNATVILYGDINIEDFLGSIGSYFINYDYKEIIADKGNSMPLAGPVTKVFNFPVESNAVAENSSVVFFGIDFGRLTVEEFSALQILGTTLNSNASPFKRKIRETLPAANVYIGIEPSIAGTYLIITGIGMNENEMETLRAVFYESIDEILFDGFDLDLLEAIIASEEFDLLTISEGGNIGAAISQSLILLDSTGFGFDYYNEYLRALDTLKIEYKNRYFENLIGRYILSNPRTVLIATVPVPGLREELDAALRADLDERKTGMAPQEIRAILDMNASIAEFNAEEAPVWMIDALNAVTVDNLPLEMKTYSVEEKFIDVMRVFEAEAAVGGINLTNIQYNSSAVPMEEMHFLKFYSALLGNVRTEKYDLPALQMRMARYLNNFYVTAGITEFFDFSFRPVLSVEWLSLNDDYTPTAELVREILLYSDFSDLDVINGVAGRIRSQMRNSINSNPLGVLGNRALAAHYDSQAYSDYLSGLAYYAFVDSIPAMIEADPEGFIAKLKAVRDKLAYKDGSVVLFAGNAEGIAVFEENLHILTGHLGTGAVPSADFSVIPRPALSEGVIVDSTVQYNQAFATYEELGLDYNGALIPLSSIITDAYITPEIRYNIGAYGAWFSVGRHGLTFASYRDPSLTETFKVFEGASDFIRTSSLAQVDIDRYIVSTFGSVTAPSGELSGAIGQMELQYRGFPENYILGILAVIKATTVNDMMNLAPYLALMMETGIRSTAGGQSAITANADLFDSVVYAFGEGASPAYLTRADVIMTVFGDYSEDLYAYITGMGMLPASGAPQDNITREEFAVLWGAALGLPVGGEFIAVPEDAYLLSEQAAGLVFSNLYFGFMQTDEAGFFNPSGFITMMDVEAALMLYMSMQ